MTAYLGLNPNGTYCLYFPHIDGGNKPIGQFETIAKAKAMAAINGYTIGD